MDKVANAGVVVLAVIGAFTVFGIAAMTMMHFSMMGRFAC